jgi:hypothetical protein
MKKLISENYIKTGLFGFDLTIESSRPQLINVEFCDKYDFKDIKIIRSINFDKCDQIHILHIPKEHESGYIRVAGQKKYTSFCRYDSGYYNYLQK